MSILDAIIPGRRARAQKRKSDALRSDIYSELLREFRATMFSGYEGASKGRPYSSWAPGEGSADEDILGDLHETRARTRDLIRNDALASGMVSTWVDDNIGSGLRPQMRIDKDELELTDDQAKAYQERSERIYHDHGKHADFAGRLTHGQLQRLSARSMYENGDSFQLFRPRPLKRRRRYSLSVQLLEADRVATPSDMANNSAVREGVKRNDDGEHLGYYVAKEHPGDLLYAKALKSTEFKYVPIWGEADRQQIFQILRVLRIDQSRGVPFIAPALPIYKDLKDYFRAELFAMKIAACYALFIVVQDPIGAATAATTRTDASGKQLERIEPGMIKHLAPGEDVKQANPERPGENFDSFVARAMRMAGLPVQMPYESATNDFSDTTYTSGRMTVMNWRRITRIQQKQFGDDFCQPYFERLLEEAYLRGDFDDLYVPGFLDRIEAWTRATWRGTGQTYIDPEKEIGAMVEALGAGLTTYEECYGERGRDWEEEFEQQARERAKRMELGLPVLEVTTSESQAAQGQDGGQESSGEGDEGDEGGAADDEGKE